MAEVPRSGNYIIVIKTNGDIVTTKLTKQPTLEQLRDGVGGDIELVPFFNKFMERECVTFCNAYGKMNGLKPNPTAQMFWSQAYGKRIYEDHLVGDILIIVGSPSFLAQL
jgi:Domain of unknown function (DUF3846)